MAKERNTKAFTIVALGVAAALALALPAAAQEFKIAVIDVARLVQDSAPGKAALAELETFGETEKARLDAQRGEIQGLQKQIADGQLSLSEDRLAELQAEFEEKTIALQRAVDDVQRVFNNRQRQAFQDIEKKIMPVIQQVGVEQGYSMIFNKFESGLVYAADSVDITNAVIERLDSMPTSGQ